MSNKSSPNLIQLIVSFSAPLSSVILMIFGSAFYTTFLSIFLDSSHYSREEIGWIHSSFYLGMFVGAFQMEKLIKRIGHIQALAVFGSLATSATLMQGLYQDFIAWTVLRFLFGLSLAALYIVIESWMLHNSTVKTRGVILSLYMISLYAAQSVSQQLLFIIDIHTSFPFMISALFTALSVIPVGLSTSRITLPSVHEKVKFFKIIKASPFGVSGCLVSGLILSALYSFFPIFSVSINIPSENLMSITIAGGALLQWPIGKLSDYFERQRVLLFVVGIALVLSVLGLIIQGASIANTLILFFLAGGLLFTLYPLSITQVCDHLENSHIVTATSLLLIAYGLGCVLGPIASSIVIERLGIHAIFLYFAALLGLLGCVGIYVTIRRPIVPLKEQTEFMPLPNMTPVAYELDPRSEALQDEKCGDSVDSLKLSNFS
ncbi:MAG: MFS transporter [Chlamydiia bacterium]|nr:MFS transporter [Chlamydiia bacterium]